MICSLRVQEKCCVCRVVIVETHSLETHSLETRSLETHDLNDRQDIVM